MTASTATAMPDSIAIINTIRSVVARVCAFICSPIRSSDRTVALNHRLAGQPLVGIESPLGRDTRFDGRRSGEMLRSLDDANPAARADPDPAAGVAEGDGGAAGHVEQGLVRLDLGSP